MRALFLSLFLAIGLVGPAAAADRYFLIVGNTNVGYVEFEGGGISASVIQESLGPDNRQKKHIGNLVYEEITLWVPTIDRTLRDWIHQALNNRHAHIDGTILTVTDKGVVTSELRFLSAVPSGIVFPALVPGKKMERIGIRLKPEVIRRQAGSGSVPAVQAPPHISSIDLRLEISGLGPITAARIEPFTIVIPPPGFDDPRDPTPPQPVSFPNLKLTLADSAAADLIGWHKTFVIFGICADDDEKTGTLSVQSKGISVFSIGLQHLGIFAIRRAGPESSGEFEVELYEETMTLN